VKHLFEGAAIVSLAFFIFSPSAASALVPVLILLFILVERLYVATLELKKPPKIDISHLEDEIKKMKEKHKAFTAMFDENKRLSDDTKKLMSQAQLALGFRRMPSKD
jgi:hypothetical protein